MNSIVTNEDCMALMARARNKQWDLAIVDPPYGIDFAKTHTGKGWVVRESEDWDKSIPPAEYFRELFRVSKNQIIWGGNYFTEHLPPSMGWILWDKGQRNFSLADGELAWTSFNRALRIYEYSRVRLNNSRGGLHPTEKPRQLYKWLLQKYAEPGWTILDTHLGKGESRMAAAELKFDFTGCEINEKYFIDHLQHWDAYKLQHGLFENNGYEPLKKEEYKQNNLF